MAPSTRHLRLLLGAIVTAAAASIPLLRAEPVDIFTIWEADTLEPGVTPLKWKLGIPEAPKSNICQ
jgi:hypothetical protein